MARRQRKLVNTRFGDIHYWYQGSGHVLLLVHQSTQSAEEFYGLGDILCKNYTVVAVDLPGHGCSGDPDHELTIEEHAESLVCVLDHAGCESVSVLGHHGGGMVAVALAANHPARVKHVITSGAGVPEAAMRDRILNEPMSRDLPIDKQGEFLQRTWSIFHSMSAPNARPDDWFKPMSVGLRARLRPYDMHRETMLFDYESALRNVTQPCLMLKGEHDHYAGDVEAASFLVTNSSIVTIPDCGAWQYSEQPAATAMVVEQFLTEQK